MTPDKIRHRFTAITLILNRSALILGIKSLLALYAIGRVLRGKTRVAYAASGTHLRRLVMQQLDSVNDS
jgi:hypothetical protein